MAIEAFYAEHHHLLSSGDDRRLDKSTQASPKYEPIEQSGRQQETSKVLNLLPKKSLFGIIFGRDQSCYDLWSDDVYFTKGTNTPCPDPQTWPHSCWKHAAIAVNPTPPTSLRLSSLNIEIKSKTSSVVKKHNWQYDTIIALHAGWTSRGGGLDQRHAFQSTLSYAHAYFARKFAHKFACKRHFNLNNISITFVT